MKTKRLLFLATVSSLLIIHSAFGQGALTPSGPPGPTMLTLSQIEPRTAISAATTITRPGSYYLTTNITVTGGNAIYIPINNVKLDLNGFTISSTTSSASGTGVYIGSGSPVTNVTVINGFISSGVTNNSTGVFGGSGFGYGVYANGVNIQVKNVAVSGCLNDGINAFQNSSVVEACMVNEAGGIGIEAQSVSDSTAVNCGNYGINADTVNNCYGQAYYNGIQALNANNSYGQSVSQAGLIATLTATGCAGMSSSSYGLDAGEANNCYGSSSTDYGITATIAVNSYGTSSSFTGIFAQNAYNCYGNCGGSGLGLQVNNIAIGCYGQSSTGTGIDALNADDCIGYSYGSGYGVGDVYIATGCYGYSSSGAGIGAFLANGCHGATSTGTALSVTHNVNSF